MSTVNYNINFSVDGGDKSGSAKTVINKKQSPKQPSSLTQQNLKNASKALLSMSGVQAGNELLGSFTENRLRQRKINVGITFAKYGVAISMMPVAGTLYMVGDLSYKTAMYGIEVQKKNREADYFIRLSGNNANSGSRYRGSYV